MTVEKLPADPEDSDDVLRGLPAFGGALLCDDGARSAAADDFGHIVHDKPLAVLKPSSVNDVVHIVEHARRRGLKIAVRGQGNSTYGQAQVKNGIVVDMSSFAGINPVGSDRVTVKAGARWDDVLQVSMERGLTPPVLTDYLKLSVGGTLSVGGMGRTTHRHGLQVDSVLELDVVTGAGELLTCSISQERELFLAMLAGLGQCGIIVRAMIRLIAAPSHVRMCRLQYSDLRTFLDDQASLAEEGRVDSIFGGAQLDREKGWRFTLELGKFYTAPARPDDAAILEGLGYEKGSEQLDDQTYIEHVTFPGKQLEQLRGAGLWDVPHPWFDIFIPSFAAAECIDSVLASRLSSSEPSFIVVGPVNTERLMAPLARVPGSKLAYSFDIARFAARDAEKAVTSMVTENKVLYESARDRGATLYPTAAIPMRPEDWARHFSAVWESFTAAKRRFDPDHVLSPGCRIFAAP